MDTPWEWLSCAAGGVSQCPESTGWCLSWALALFAVPVGFLGAPHVEAFKLPSVHSSVSECV